MLEKIKSYVAAFIAVLMAVKELVLLVEVPGNGEAKRRLCSKASEFWWTWPASSSAGCRLSL